MTFISEPINMPCLRPTRSGILPKTRLAIIQPSQTAEVLRDVVAAVRVKYSV